MASACTKQSNSNSGDNDITSDDLWSLVLSVDGGDKLENTKLIDSTYKIEIIVEGVCTRALLDHGSQVIIVRRQLLGKVKEKQQWSLEISHLKEIPLENQPAHWSLRDRTRCSGSCQVTHGTRCNPGKSGGLLFCIGLK